MTSPRQLDDLLRTYIADFVARNRAAQTLKKGLDEVGVGFSPSADHLTFRARADEKAHAGCGKPLDDRASG